MNCEYCLFCLKKFPGRVCKNLAYGYKWILKFELITYGNVKVNDSFRIYLQLKELFPELLVQYKLGITIIDSIESIKEFNDSRWTQYVNIIFTSYYPVSKYYIYHKMHTNLESICINDDYFFIFI